MPLTRCPSLLLCPTAPPVHAMRCHAVPCDAMPFPPCSPRDPLYHVYDAPSNVASLSRSPLYVGDVVQCRLRGLLARVVPGSLVGARKPQPDNLGGGGGVALQGGCVEVETLYR